MSIKKDADLKAMLDSLVKNELPAIMTAIMADNKTAPDIKASRVGLASMALHHLRLLRAAIEG